MREAVERGRKTGNVGLTNGRARLDPEKVIVIRARFALGGITKAALAAEFDVTEATIRCVVNRTTWGDI